MDISRINPGLAMEVKAQLAAALSEAVARDPRSETELEQASPDDAVREHGTHYHRLGLRTRAGDGSLAIPSTGDDDPAADDDHVIVMEPWLSKLSLTDTQRCSADVEL